jgi:hypothetical protein
MKFYGKSVRSHRAAWYCQNGCIMHWTARKPDTRCPYCSAAFIDSDRAYLQKHPGDDIGTLAQKAASQLVAAREALKLLPGD